MGHKVSPTALRLGKLYSWKSKWLANKQNYRKFLEEDFHLRNFVLKKLKDAAIESVDIERSANLIKVVIRTARPGIIIGRGGKGIEDLRGALGKLVANKSLKVSIEEVKNSQASAALIAHTVAEALEKRIPFRRVIKQALERNKESRVAKGAKIMVAGRLNGTAMSRREWVSWGEIPLHNLRADVDFAKDIAQTKYGVIGIKVWIYKGEVFVDQERKKQED